MFFRTENPLKEALDAIKNLAENEDFEEEDENGPYDDHSKNMSRGSNDDHNKENEDLNNREEVVEEPFVERIYPMLGPNSQSK